MTFSSWLLVPNGFLMDIFRGLAAHNAGTQRDPDVTMTGLNDVLKISGARLRYAGHIDVYRSNTHESSIVFPVNEPLRLFSAEAAPYARFNNATCNIGQYANVGKYLGKSYKTLPKEILDAGSDFGNVEHHTLWIGEGSNLKYLADSSTKCNDDHPQ